MANENRHAKVVHGMARFHLKLLEVSHANLDMAFEFAEELMTVNSPSEFIEVYTKHARRQFEAHAKHVGELMQVAQEVAIEKHGALRELVFRRRSGAARPCIGLHTLLQAPFRRLQTTYTHTHTHPLYPPSV
jgi:hypothetical protein